MDRKDYQDYLNWVEEQKDNLYAPASHPRPNGWARLHIDMTLMQEEQRRKVYEAEMLLREAGVSFDNGSGSGFRDWELDWSLEGAIIETRPLLCKVCREPLLGHVYWGDFDKGHGAYMEPFCSPAHMEQERIKATAGGGMFLGMELVDLTPHPPLEKEQQ